MISSSKLTLFLYCYNFLGKEPKLWSPTEHGLVFYDRLLEKGLGELHDFHRTSDSSSIRDKFQCLPYRIIVIIKQGKDCKTPNKGQSNGKGSPW